MPEEPGPAAFERRIVSVLFADLVGFTSLSEQLDPEDVAAIQDAYFAAVRETVARHGGVLEKFIGDAAMAVFGIPRARDDDAERAIRAGLALVGAVEALGARLGLEEGTGLRLRVGVNSGEVVSAEGGPDQGRVTGDTVNLAARFQAVAEPGSVLVGELTQLSAADAVAFEPMGGLDLKGKAEPVPAWRAVGLRSERSREEALGALRAPLLGRVAEMEALTGSLQRTRSGGTIALLVVAPPGVGKSRLLLEFAARADTSGARVLRARVRPEVIGPAETVGQLLLAALGDGVTRESAPGALGAALAAAGIGQGRAAVVVDEVAVTLWPVSTAQDGIGAIPDRDARFEAWLEALDALAGDRLSTWLVEDVHWAGGDLLAFLAAAAMTPARGGRLVVATARPSVLEHPPAGFEVLELPPLPVVDATELVHALVGEALPDEVVRAVAERSDGNPLFIEELLRSWISAGTLVAGGGETGGGGWWLAVAPDAVPLPATVQAIYAAQLDDLPGPARLVARRASVAGRRFAVGALEPLEVPDPEAGLQPLRQRAFIRGPERDSVGDEVYAYRHALLRDAGYASLSRAERGRLHLALAAWLEQTAGFDVARVAEPIASHYESALAALPAVGTDAEERARLADAARTWLERAAEAALGVAAHEAAIGLLARAVSLADGERERARLRLRRGELMTQSGDMDAGMDEILAAREAFALAHEAVPGDTDARSGYGNATAALAEAMCEQIRFIEARDLVAEALAHIGPPDDAIHGRLLALHAYARVLQGDRVGTVRDIDRAWTLVRGGDPRLEVEVLGWRAAIQSESDIPADWATLEAAARSLGMWRVAVGAILMRVGNDFAVPPRDVLEAITGGIDLAVSHGLTEPACRARFAAVETMLQTGDWDAAIASGLENLEVTERFAYARPTFRTWMAMVPILAARRERDLLARYRRWLVANRRMFPEPMSAYGQVLNVAADRALAEVTLDAAYGRSIEPATVALESYSNPDYLTAVESIIRGWLADGAVERAAVAIAAIRHNWLVRDQTAPSPLMEASVGLMAAWLARAEGNAGETRETARASLVDARRAEAPWWVARASRALPEGAATAEELAEAEAIEARLRVVPGASAPPV